MLKDISRFITRNHLVNTVGYRKAYSTIHVCHNLPGIYQKYSSYPGHQNVLRPSSLFGIFHPCRSFQTKQYPHEAAAQSMSTATSQTPHKVLILGAGGMSIGQAPALDLFSSQAIRALSSEQITTVLLNPNVAALSTDTHLADELYFLPVTPEYVEKVIEKEKPDGVIITFGGQVGLQCGLQLAERGIFKKHNVKILGSSAEKLQNCVSRNRLFKLIKDAQVVLPVHATIRSIEEALSGAENIGYPLIVRPNNAVGGRSEFAYNVNDLRRITQKILLTDDKVILERSVKGWKSVEYEVLRDEHGLCIPVCSMEAMDPLGIHSGDSVIVAPAQSIPNKTLRALESATLNIVQRAQLVGSCNVQFAVNPDNHKFAVIGLHPRLSQSSLLSSDATGIMSAYVSAKLSLGHSLSEYISNTGVNREYLEDNASSTEASTADSDDFRVYPIPDHVVCKVPKWEFGKFHPAIRELSSHTKSVGSAVGIGKTFEEALQKAMRMVDPQFNGFHSRSYGNLQRELQNPTDQRLFAIGNAFINDRFSVEKIQELTRIDEWFLRKMKGLADIESSLNKYDMPKIPETLLLEAKRAGYSDKHISSILDCSELDLRRLRQGLGIRPKVSILQHHHKITTYPVKNNLLYVTYQRDNDAVTEQATSMDNFLIKDDVDFNHHGIMVLGSGVNHIGSSMEYDWCASSCVRTLRNLGYKTTLVNHTPEVVSSDNETDANDNEHRFYLEEITFERVMDIYEKESPLGMIVSMGGQLPHKFCTELYQHQQQKNQPPLPVNILGTSPQMINISENRAKFARRLDRIGVEQPAWREFRNIDDARQFSEQIGYPCLVKPSYGSAGEGMNVAKSPEELEKCLIVASSQPFGLPVVISKFIENALDLDFDAVAKDGKIVAYAVSEHVEKAGVHSGDATLILPATDVDPLVREKAKLVAEKLAEAFQVTGPFNVQFAFKDGRLMVISSNLRASRTFPFVSKALGVDFVELATKVMCGVEVNQKDWMSEKRNQYECVRLPQFSFSSIAAADPSVGVEMSSTGEVACFGENRHEAFLNGMQALYGFHQWPQKNILILTNPETDAHDFLKVAEKLVNLGISMYGNGQTVHLINQYAPQFPMIPLAPDKEGDVMSLLIEPKIDLVMAMTTRTLLHRDDSDYKIRRQAIELSVPVILDSQCAKLFVESLEATKDVPIKELISKSARSWKSYVS